MAAGSPNGEDDTTRRYQSYCRQLRTDPCPEVLVALQLGVTELRLTRAFDPSSLLPLGEVLKTDTTLTHLDLSQVRLEDSAAYVVRAAPATPATGSLKGL